MYRFAVALALPLLVLQACASYRPSEDVTRQMARTEAVIQQADRSNVAVNALPELQKAKDKYTQAKLELAKKSGDSDRRALQLAKEAEVDANYASARSQSETQEAATEQVQKGVDTLRQETARAAGTP
jgi:hypothetical protein